MNSSDAGAEPPEGAPPGEHQREGAGPLQGGEPPEGAAPLEGERQSEGAGPPHDGDPPQGADLARQALEQAKADARRRGAAPGRQRTQTPRGRDQSRTRGSVTGGEPQSLGSAIEELLATRGWEVQASVATVFARWPDIVGSELAAHTRPESFDDGELVVVADSPAWATQVRLLTAKLIGRLREELGDSSVRRVRVHGPAGPPRSGGGSGISGARRT